MTDSSIFDDIDKPKKKYCTCSNKKKQQKQTVLWTIYHTILAVELAIIILIESLELWDFCRWAI
tara:strand:+ start:538 stop:729 length:192 start_codon:yes stop_codon:yes gene_type:complete